MSDYCKFCGAPLEEESNFCGKCGKKTGEQPVTAKEEARPVVEQKEAEPPVLSEETNAVVDARQIIMTEHPQQTETPPTAEPTSPVKANIVSTSSPKTKKKKRPILIVAVFLVITAIACVVALSPSNSAKDGLPIGVNSMCPALETFESELTREVISFFEAYDIDAKSKKFIPNNFEVLATENNDRRQGVSCTYGPNNGFALMGNVEDGYVYCIYSVVSMSHMDYTPENVRYVSLLAMVPAGLFNNEFQGNDGLIHLLDIIANEGAIEVDYSTGRETASYSIDGITYELSVSDVFISFSIEVNEFPSPNETDFGKDFNSESEQNPSFGEETDCTAFCNMVEGIWVDKSSCAPFDEDDAMFSFCSFTEGGMFLATYPGGADPLREIVNVRVNENQYTLIVYSPAMEWMGDYYEEEYADCTLQFSEDSFFFTSYPETLYTYMGKDLDSARKAVVEFCEGKNSVISGNSTYTGIMRVDGLSCYLELPSPISYQDPYDDVPITSAELWLSESDANELKGFSGLTVTLEGTLFNYRGGGTLMFETTPTVVYASGIPDVSAECASYPNWDSADNETIFWDALEVLRTIIYRCDGVWDVRTLCDSSVLDSINSVGFTHDAVSLQINGSWVSDYGYELHVTPREDCVLIVFGPEEGPSTPVWQYDWDGNLIDAVVKLEDYILSEGLV